MDQGELVRSIAIDVGGVTQPKVREVLESLGRQLAELRPGEEIRTAAVGTFICSHKGPRVGRNPRTGLTVEIAPSNVVRFKAAKYIRDMLNPS